MPAHAPLLQGPVSAYFTVFAASFLPIHTTKITRADDVYSRNLGSNLLKVGVEFEHLPVLPQILYLYTCACVFIKLVEMQALWGEP